MSYIKYSEYTAIKGLETLTEETFNALSWVAKIVVDGITFDAIERFHLIEDEDYKPRIVRATALIIDSASRNGGLDAYLSLEGKDISSLSETIGGYSHSISYRDGRLGTVEGIPIPPLAKILLNPIVAIGRQR